MKIEKLLHRLQALFDPAKHKKRQHIEELKKILLKLKKKERKITLALHQTDEDCLRSHYQTELEIIRVQRKKGIEVLQQLKERKGTPPPSGTVLTNNRSALINTTSED